MPYRVSGIFRYFCRDCFDILGKARASEIANAANDRHAIVQAQQIATNMAKGKTILQSMAIDKPAQVLVKETGRKKNANRCRRRKKEREKRG